MGWIAPWKDNWTDKWVTRFIKPGINIDNGLALLKTALIWIDGDDPAANGTPYANNAAMGISGTTPWINKGAFGTSFALTQGTSARRPVYNKNVVGSHNGITFNGSNNVLSSAINTGNLGINVAGTAFEYYGVFISSSSNIQFINASNTGTGNYETNLNAAAGYSANLNGNISPTVGSASAYTNGSPHIFNTRVDTAGNGISRIDGVDGSPVANCFSTNSSTFALGERANTSFPFSGQILQFAVFNFYLSSAQRAALERYWASLFGIILP